MNIKKIVSLSLIIFVIAILSFLFFAKKPSNVAKNVPIPLTGGTNLILNMQEISKHNSKSSCWMIIGSKVYDVTQVIYSHPGGSRTILSHCGQESTNAWNTKDSFPGVMHSMAAQLLLKNYLLGDLNQTIFK